jgi:hypothetical protein
MTRKQYQRHSPEFKLHALKRASEDGVTDKDICEEIDQAVSSHCSGTCRFRYAARLAHNQLA